MKAKVILIVLALAAMLALAVGLSAAQGPNPVLPTGQAGGEPQALVGSTFTYQGHLKKGGSPVNANCNMAFRLYDAATGGNLQGIITTTVNVESGLFTVLLDFGEGPFTGEARWLGIAVKCPGDAAFTTLSPRQELTAAPYALSLRPGAAISGAVRDGAILYALNTDTEATLFAYGLMGRVSSTKGYGVVGHAYALSGETYGVYGQSDSTDGHGVYGVGVRGVYGVSDSTKGRGVIGYATATNGDARGVVGYSDSTGGTGVFGRANATTGTTYGVYGWSDSTAGRGVYGVATATTGYVYGVYGESNSTQGSGVRGVAAGSGYVSGVFGETASPNGYGVYGLATATSGSAVGVAARSYSTDGYGVWAWASATTGTTYGVYGRSTSSFVAYGVYGYAPNGTGTGVYGEGASYGVKGQSSSTGVSGTATGSGGIGVHGYTDSGTGASYAIAGFTNSTDGWAGRFSTSYGNGVYISSNASKVALVVTGGSKSAAVATDQGARLLYTEESAEVWFTDYGFGRLQDGRATIAIDPLFAQTVNLKEPYHVFIQVYGGAQVYVSKRTPTSFEVRLWAGDPNVEFSYRIVAKRLGFEDRRLDPFPAGDNDPVLYPDRTPAEP